MKLYLLFLTYCCINWTIVESYNILAIFTPPLPSHYNFFKPFLEELALKGHNVTVINHYPSKHKSRNFHDLDISDDIDKRKIKASHPFHVYESIPKFLHKFYNLYAETAFAIGPVVDQCDLMFKKNAVKELIAARPNYDVAIVEMFCSDCELGFASWLGVPTVGMTTHVLMPWSYSRLGLPFDASKDSFYFHDAGHNPSFMQKLEISIMDIIYNTIVKWIVHYRLHNVFQKHLPSVPDLEYATRNVSITLVNQYFPLTGEASLNTPKIIDVGGLQIHNQGSSLPEDIKSILDSNKNGVVYVSFGSILQATTMSRYKLDQMFAAFSNLKQSVLWKWEGEDERIPGAPENVYSRKWLPQADVLCHENVVAFISHGGMLGLSEAIHCGVPTLAVPFFGDQFSNAASVRDSGLGSILYYQDFTNESLSNALGELLKPASLERARKLSKRWRDRPLSAMDQAVYWTEWVARHQPSASQTTTRHTFCTIPIDVTLFFLAVVISLYLTVRMLKNLYYLIIVRFKKTKAD